MPQRLSEEKVQERIANLASRGITVLGRDYREGNLCFAAVCQCGYEWKARSSRLQIRACPKCAGKKKGLKRRLSEEKIEQFRVNLASRGIAILKVAFERYTHFRVRCQCGHEWGTRPALLKDHGCKKCHFKQAGVALRYPEADIEQLRIDLPVRGITVLKAYHKGGHSLCALRCRCGHEWSARVGKLKKGAGCGKCGSRGFDWKAPAIAYYVRFESLYKIGISNRTVRERFYTEGLRPEIIQIWNFTKGADAYEFEQKVIRENAFDLYHGPQILKFTGNDEFFVRDVLGLDGAERVQQELQFAA